MYIHNYIASSIFKLALLITLYYIACEADVYLFWHFNNICNYMGFGHQLHCLSASNATNIKNNFFVISVFTRRPISWSQRRLQRQRSPGSWRPPLRCSHSCSSDFPRVSLFEWLSYSHSSSSDSPTVTTLRVTPIQSLLFEWLPYSLTPLRVTLLVSLLFEWLSSRSDSLGHGCLASQQKRLNPFQIYPVIYVQYIYVLLVRMAEICCVLIYLLLFL